MAEEKTMGGMKSGSERIAVRAESERRAPVRDVFDAVADPTRRRLIRMLAEAGELPLHRLTEPFPMGRTAVSKHLAILKEAGLVRDRKAGRETRYRLDAAPLKEIRDWLSFYSRFWSENMMRLGQLLEDEAEAETAEDEEDEA